MMTNSEALDELRAFMGMCPDARISTPDRVVDNVRERVIDSESRIADAEKTAAEAAEDSCADAREDAIDKCMEAFREELKDATILAPVNFDDLAGKVREKI